MMDKDTRERFERIERNLERVGERLDHMGERLENMRILVDHLIRRDMEGGQTQ